jgi:hypothetical protein
MVSVRKCPAILRVGAESIRNRGVVQTSLSEVLVACDGSCKALGDGRARKIFKFCLRADSSRTDGFLAVYMLRLRYRPPRDGKFVVD